MLKKILLLLLLININLFATQNIKEIYVVSEEWEGFTNKDHSGLYFEIVRMVYEPEGIKVKIKLYPYNRASMLVGKKEADVWLASFLDEEDYAIYPKQHFDNDVVTAMYKTSRFPNFKGISSLKNKNVCWIRGYSYDEYIDIEMNKHERNDRKSILKSLKNDRFAVFLADESDIHTGIKKIKFDTSEYSFKHVLNIKLYPAFRNDDKGYALRDIWDKNMNILMKNGSIRKLFKKYDYENKYVLWFMNEK